MKYKEIFKNENDEILERYELSFNRIKEIETETLEDDNYYSLYFNKTAKFIVKIFDVVELVEHDKIYLLNQEALKQLNNELYEDILPQNYNQSFGNIVYASQVFNKKVENEDIARIMSFLYYEIRGMIIYAFECRKTEITLFSELFIQVYNIFREEELNLKELKDAIYWFISDNADIFVDYRIRECLDYNLDFAVDIIMNNDLNDIRYLYYYGEYITENEIKTAKYLNSLDDITIGKMADTFTEGYRLGFVNSGKDLSIKGTVNIRYNIGFERVIKKAIENFYRMGLKPVIYRYSVSRINSKQTNKIGYVSTTCNKQYEYDHKMDDALFLDKDFVERKLGVIKTSYEKYKNLAYMMAGPACMEVFGETPFEPKNNIYQSKLNNFQQQLYVDLSSANQRIVNDYIKGEERSFTIIAFPIPEIGENYEEIFKQTIDINTLDQKKYEIIQQNIIDVLDLGDYVYIKGKDNNKTDMKVCLHNLKNPSKETNFENCLADVNIPLGEVFTSPVLNNTNGIINVSEVYLNDLKFIDLSVVLENGMVKDYTCKNFKDEAENKRFIKENLLFNHETLPIGEFAIGTNTTAYKMANDFNIVYKLPILIVEKMGPHFALGDTCYSFEEDIKVYNRDKKEIIARENEKSALRNKDIKKAYFNCHTDITIPYDEIGEISVVCKNGKIIPIISDGRFVLDGTEELNLPFINL